MIQNFFKWMLNTTAAKLFSNVREINATVINGPQSKILLYCYVALRQEGCIVVDAELIFNIIELIINKYFQLQYKKQHNVWLFGSFDLKSKTGQCNVWIVNMNKCTY